MIKISKFCGFTLVEMLVAIIVLGILSSLAVNYMASSIDDGRRAATEKEMMMLVQAIVGNPSLMQGGHRTDFGYFGDIGNFPPNLQSLYNNPGLATWNGPYISGGFLQDSIGFKYDEWGDAYNYGVTSISSSGSGSSITFKVAENADDYLNNTINGAITDGRGNLPGAAYYDSVQIVVYYPDGTGGMTAKTAAADASGNFVIDSIPAGNHRMLIIFEPAADTLVRMVAVFPRNKGIDNYSFAAAYFE